ncbi:hypothetical protein BV898_00561 [Hypsibius exemplaris]|uniref:Receptor ligand binding region domain-containing protein n=1 Tax=Hypsibius exemplaris TaxID=2072580 RepID=A0A1W0XDR7_HYPEX|nr:hypothetical protein BV898_00561 [Hypsibius exemplaris]
MLNFQLKWAVFTLSFTWVAGLSEDTEIVPNFISYTSTSSSWSGFIEIQPVFEVILEQLAPKFPLVLQNYTKQNSTYLSTPGSCNEPEIDGHFEEVDHLFRDNLLSPSPTVVLAAVCGLNNPTIADFARETDVLVVTCQSEDGTLEDRNRFPTAISFSGGVINIYGDALVALLDHFNWSSIVILDDFYKTNRGQAKSREQCRGAIEAVTARKHNISLLVIAIDLSVETSQSAAEALWKASNFSRIILSCTLGSVQREFLAAAHDQNMTKGDYVFLHLYEVESPFDYHLVWQRNDTLDERVRIAMQSTIVIRSPPIAWPKIATTISAIQKRKVNLFGGSGRLQQQPNEFMVSCAEALEGAIIAMNESCASSRKSCRSGKSIADRMIGKVFDLPTRQVKITHRGVRRIEVLVQQLSPTDFEMKDVFMYNSETQALNRNAVNKVIWILNGKAPLHRPRCGLQGELCHQAAVTEVIVGVLVGSCVATAIFFMVFWWTKNAVPANWWHVHENLLQPHADPRDFLKVLAAQFEHSHNNPITRHTLFPVENSSVAL